MSPPSYNAFVSSIVPLNTFGISFHGTSVKSSRQPNLASRSVVRASLSDKKSTGLSRAEEDRLAKEESQYRGPQGFTPYAEKVNGRLAQLGFAIGLVTELVSGKPIGAQILYMFAPLTHLASYLSALATNTNIDKMTM